jgi:hypothetical protein
MLIVQLLFVLFSGPSEGPHLEEGGVHDHSDVRQDEEQPRSSPHASPRQSPCNHFIAFPLFALFFIIFS